MPPFQDLTGRRFGIITVLSRAPKTSSLIRWNCVCACGAHLVVFGQSLREGATKSCMCARGKYDYIGQKFGRLTVIAKVSGTKRGNRWHCVCDCGNAIAVFGASLRRNMTKSCGCYSQELKRQTDGSKGVWSDGKPTRETCSWASAKARCYRQSDPGFANYGGRGIKMCDRWRYDFREFFADMGQRPQGMSLDRIDNNGDYTPQNCRWATDAQQKRNRRTNVWVTFRGKRMIRADFAAQMGFDVGQVNRMHHDKGLTMEEIYARLSPCQTPSPP